MPILSTVPYGTMNEDQEPTYMVDPVTHEQVESAVNRGPGLDQSKDTKQERPPRTAPDLVGSPQTIGWLTIHTRQSPCERRSPFR